MTTVHPDNAKIDSAQMQSIKTCAGCGKSFSCGADAGSCWCMDLPVLPRQLPGSGCYCRECLQRELASASPQVGSQVG